jgi:hypothetical protein
MTSQTIRETLAASVGGEARFASSFSHRTMRDLNTRAARELDDGAAECTAMLERVAHALTEAGLVDYRQCDDAELTARYVRFWSAWQHAASRVANWMVTGPANFPVARNQKAIATEDRRYEELRNFVKAASIRAVKRAKGAQKAAIGIAGLKSAELDDLRAKLDLRQRRQDMMKAVNAIIRKHRLTATSCTPDQLCILMMETPHRIAASTAAAVLVPNYAGKIGFESYSLSNNNAEIHRLRDRVAQVEKALAAAQVEDEAGPAPARTVGDCEIIENAAEDRLQLVFPGKPDDALRTALKRHGFRWSPRNGAWQRQLTNNARQALNWYVLPLLQPQTA